MCGVIPVLSIVPLWQACGHLYLYVSGFNNILLKMFDLVKLIHNYAVC
jgi:hypothetical protein